MTGGTGVANDLDCSLELRCHNELVGVLVSFEIVDFDALLVNWVMGVRMDILPTRFLNTLLYGQIE